jgi:DNA primase catalytic subunit
VLPCEIILDIDDNISEERLNKICDELDHYGFNYKAYATGSKGYHIHIFDDDLTKYTEKSRYKIRHYLISMFKCDGHMASGNVLIAIENMPHFKTGNVKTVVRKSK